MATTGFLGERTIIRMMYDRIVNSFKSISWIPTSSNVVFTVCSGISIVRLKRSTLRSSSMTLWLWDSLVIVHFFSLGGEAVLGIATSFFSLSLRTCAVQRGLKGASEFNLMLLSAKHLPFLSDWLSLFERGACLGLGVVHLDADRHAISKTGLGSVVPPLYAEMIAISTGLSAIDLDNVIRKLTRLLLDWLAKFSCSMLFCGSIGSGAVYWFQNWSRISYMSLGCRFLDDNVMQSAKIVSLEPLMSPFTTSLAGLLAKSFFFGSVVVPSDAVRRGDIKTGLINHSPLRCQVLGDKCFWVLAWDQCSLVFDVVHTAVMFLSGRYSSTASGSIIFIQENTRVKEDLQEQALPYSSNIHVMTKAKEQDMAARSPRLREVEKSLPVLNLLKKSCVHIYIFTY